jgi:hypothetical protein
VVRRWHGPRLDLLQLNRRVEDVDRGVDVVEVDHQLPELVLAVLDLARDLGALGNQPGQNMWLRHKRAEPACLPMR